MKVTKTNSSGMAITSNENAGHKVRLRPIDQRTGEMDLTQTLYPVTKLSVVMEEDGSTPVKLVPQRLSVFSTLPFSTMTPAQKERANVYIDNNGDSCKVPLSDITDYSKITTTSDETIQIRDKDYMFLITEDSGEGD